jgi:hypothetical protein
MATLKFFIDVFSPETHLPPYQNENYDSCKIWLGDKWQTTNQEKFKIPVFQNPLKNFNETHKKELEEWLEQTDLYFIMIQQKNCIGLACLPIEPDSGIYFIKSINGKSQEVSKEFLEEILVMSIHLQ